MIIVTGGAGFIGTNIVRKLNERGIDNVLVVDNLERTEKFRNLSDCRIADYMDKNEFRRKILSSSKFGQVEAVFHQGACSDTMETDGRYMIDNNHSYSRDLFQYCAATKIPLVYASSASVYGSGSQFREEPECEAPVNIYGYSKLLFDQYVRRNHREDMAQVVGLRYFNVYGDRERHKGRMASVAYHFYNQFMERGVVSLFEGSDGYANGDQRRDFVFVEDVVDINLYVLEHPGIRGIFNVGTGMCRSFNEVAVTVINRIRFRRGEKPLSLADVLADGMIEYIPFPPALSGRYQSYTQADISNLRDAGYSNSLGSVEHGVSCYVDHLLDGNPSIESDAAVVTRT